MTKPRKKPSSKFHAFLVEPEPGFRPTNWQQNPQHYRILEYVGAKHFKGRADAWKFLHNHDQLNLESIKQWAIYLDFDSSFFGAEAEKSETAPATTRCQNLASENLASGFRIDSKKSLIRNQANFCF